VTPVEDRTRAAMDAITGLVEGVPPLTLPPPDGAASRRRGRVPSPRRRWGSLLAPTAAAAAVLAIAIALVAVRDMPGGRRAPAASPALPAAAVPRYYVTFTAPRGFTTTPVSLVLGATLTGKKLFTLRPPRYSSFAGITGAADDRTFVAETQRYPWGVWGQEGRSRTWYLVRIVGTGSQVALRMTRLPIPRTPVGTCILGISLSPDGTKLAVATEPCSTNPSIPQQLRVYSVATGAVLRSWSTPPGQGPLYSTGPDGPDDNAVVSWVGDGALAFLGAPAGSKGVVYVMVLDISRPDGDLVSSARPAVLLQRADTERHAPFGCGGNIWGDVLITGDGKSYVCGGSGASSARLPALYCLKRPTWNTVAFAGYPLATRKPRGFLSGYLTGCSGYNVGAYALWANATGSTVIGYMFFGDKTSGRFGVFSRGAFRPLPIPVPGNSYQYFGGSLLNQVAW